MLKRTQLPLLALLLLPTGCMGPSTPDFPNIAAAFKFVGCCSVVCALIWAYAIVTSSNNRKGGK